MTQILVLFYSRTGHIADLAEAVAAGIELGGGEAKVRTVPHLRPASEPASEDAFESELGYLFATKDDLRECDGLALAIGGCVPAAELRGRAAGEAARWDWMSARVSAKGCL